MKRITANSPRRPVTANHTTKTRRRRSWSSRRWAARHNRYLCRTACSPAAVGTVATCRFSYFRCTSKRPPDGSGRWSDHYYHRRHHLHRSTTAARQNFHPGSDRRPVARAAPHSCPADGLVPDCALAAVFFFFVFFTRALPTSSCRPPHTHSKRSNTWRFSFWNKPNGTAVRLILTRGGLAPVADPEQNFGSDKFLDFQKKKCFTTIVKVRLLDKYRV